MKNSQEEAQRLRQMREEGSVFNTRLADVWSVAPVGYTEAATEYVIQYREENGTDWFDCMPFYDPVRPDPATTGDKEEAYEVAAALLAGTQRTHRQARMERARIVAVQVVERVASATVIKRLT